MNPNAHSEPDDLPDPDDLAILSELPDLPDSLLLFLPDLPAIFDAFYFSTCTN